jgi:DNA-binding LacI/PurR family transcriptional regulator
VRNSMRNNKTKRRSRRATRDDVARLAGVSGATVSRVFNRSQEVQPATVEQVLAASRKLNYYPNTAARSLMLGKSHAIGVLLPDLPGGDFLSLEAVHSALSGIAEVAISRAYLVTLLFERDTQNRLVNVAKLFHESKLDGVVILTGGLDARIVWQVCREDLPHVVIFGEYQNMPSSSVSVDMRKAMLLLVEHLANLGHRRIGFLYGSGILRAAAGKMEDFVWAMKKCGLVVAEECVRMAESVAYRSCYKLAEALLELHRPPTAIVADSQSTAVPALSAIRDRGLRVPTDISLVGFAPSRCDLLDLSWTQVNFPTRQLGTRAAELVIADAEGEPQGSVSDVLSPELSVGSSSAAPSKSD